MSDELRDTLDRAAPTALAEPDFEQVWHRGRRRRRARHLSTVVATIVLIAAAGWTTQQVTAPRSLEVVGQPDGRGSMIDEPSTVPYAPPGYGPRSARQLLEEWHETTGLPIVVPTQLPDGIRMPFANHYFPTSADVELPPVSACIIPAGTTHDKRCVPTNDPSPRTSFDVDGHTVVLEVHNGSRDRTVLDFYKELDWTTAWRQVEWLDTVWQ